MKSLAARLLTRLVRRVLGDPARHAALPPAGADDAWSWSTSKRAIS